VPAIAGHQRAFAMLVLGEGFSADEAKQAGLIWDVVSEEELEEKTLALAHRLAARAPESVRISKQLMKSNSDSVSERIMQEVTLFGQRLRSDEAKNAFMAFMTRKK
jgi:enoyl-CoA hydratase/carnithine racemase